VVRNNPLYTLCAPATVTSHTVVFLNYKRLWCYLETAEVFFEAHVMDVFHVQSRCFDVTIAGKGGDHTAVTIITVTLGFTRSLHIKNLIHKIPNFF
jgi:hypothetical protein